MLSPGASPNFAALADGNVVIPPDVTGAVGAQLSHGCDRCRRAGAEQSGVAIDSMTEAIFWSAAINGASLPTRGSSTTRFMIGGCSARSRTGPADISAVLGSSANSNPTGSWHLYAIDIDPADNVRAPPPVPRLQHQRDRRASKHVLGHGQLVCGITGVRVRPGCGLWGARPLSIASSRPTLQLRWTSGACDHLRQLRVAGPCADVDRQR